MKKLCLVVIALCASAFAQTGGQGQTGNYNGGVQIYKVATLPLTATKGTLATVTDGSSASDCSTGGGTTVVTCIYNGSAWVFAGSSASSPSFSAIGAGANTNALAIGNGGSFTIQSGGTLTCAAGSTCPSGGITNGVASEPYFATGSTSGASTPNGFSSQINISSSTTDRCSAILTAWRNSASASNANSLNLPVDARGEVANATGTHGVINCASSMFPIGSVWNGSDPNGGEYDLPNAIFSTSAPQQITTAKLAIRTGVQGITTSGTYQGAGFQANSSWNPGSGASTSGTPYSSGFMPGLLTLGASAGQLIGSYPTLSNNPSGVQIGGLQLDCNSQPNCIPFTAFSFADQTKFPDGLGFRNQLGAAAIIGPQGNAGVGFVNGFFSYNGASVYMTAASENASWKIVSNGQSPVTYLLVFSPPTGPPTGAAAPQVSQAFSWVGASSSGAHYTIPAGTQTTPGFTGIICAVSTGSSSNSGYWVDPACAGVSGLFSAANQFAVKVRTLNGTLISQTDTESGTTSNTLKWSTDAGLWITGGTGPFNWAFNQTSISASGDTVTATGLTTSTSSGTCNGSTSNCVLSINSSTNYATQFNPLTTYAYIKGCGDPGNNGVFQILSGGSGTTSFTVADPVGTASDSGCSAIALTDQYGTMVSGGNANSTKYHDEDVVWGLAFALDNTTTDQDWNTNCAAVFGCVYISSNYPVTGLDLKIQSLNSIGGNIIVYDQANGNTLTVAGQSTCGNGRAVLHYKLDPSGYPSTDACYESGFMNGWLENNGVRTLYVSGTAVFTVSASGALTAASATLNGALTLNGSSSGSASISVPAAAGSTSTWLMPTSDPTNGQMLSAGAPSGGKVQLSWASASGSGTVSSSTSGYIAQYTGATTVGTPSPLLDNGVTSTSTLSYNGSGGIASTNGGGFTSSGGSNAGILSLAGNTSNPSIPSNSFAFLGPPSASFTKYAFQFPSGGFSAGQGIAVKAASSNINTVVPVWIDLPCSDTSSSATTYTCATGLSLSSLSAGMCFDFYAINQNNSGSSTLNIDSIGAKTLKKWQGTNLASGDLTASSSQKVCYDGTNLEVSTIGNAPSGGSSAESSITAPTASNTIAETAAGDWIARNGVETANLTAPWSFSDANSTNNNTDLGLLVGVSGSSTGGIAALFYDVSGTGDIARFYSGGSVSSNAYTAGTLEAEINTSGQLALQGGSCTTGTAGAWCPATGTAPTAASGYNQMYSGTSSSPVIMGHLGTAATGPMEVENVTTQTGTYSIALTDYFVICNSSSAFTVTAPVTNQTTGKVYVIKNKGAGTCTVAAASGNIDGSATYPLAQYQSVNIFFDGTQYWIF